MPVDGSWASQTAPFLEMGPEIQNWVPVPASGAPGLAE